ncbi:MAG: LptA/OstA family protein [Geothrix sp.]|uniref:LptA/OstA family protein n=1 Tax=Geothrix sp. TaxID=1962974 RepID=UPI003BB026C1
MKGSALLQDLPPARHPLWRRLGWCLVAGTLGLTLHFLTKGSEGMPGRTVGGDALFGEGTRGTKGTLTEQLGPNRMVLSYKAISGSEQDLLLEHVTGRLEEQAGQWRLLSPKARRQAGVWTLQGPMDLGVAQPGTTVPLGKGRIESEGPALRWNGGEWEGLAPLRWESMEGASRGLWNLPAGWRRETDGKLRVEHGPVRWQAPVGGPAAPTLQAMDAERLWTTPGFQTGHLEGVRARLSEGSLQASVADLSPDTVTWPGPLSFERADGWRGEAQGGRAPRPQPGSSFQQVEFRTFRARRTLGAGEEQLSTDGARWTPAGLRLEGSVVWDQPVDGQRLTLKAPRVFMREAAGKDLPESLPVGHAVAEGQALLTWGRRTLSSPRIQVERATRRWTLQGPVVGRGEDGTFTGGAGHGDPRSWTIEGPVQVNLFSGGSLRGAKLVWEDALWTLTGRPAAWTRLRERLSGSRILRKGEQVNFPEGLSGALAAADGDLFLRAERGQSEVQKITLSGGVECQGQGWRLAADTVVVTLGADRSVKVVQAKGSVSLRGRLGEGQGEALELEPETQTVKWQGRVRGKGAGSGW